MATDPVKDDFEADDFEADDFETTKPEELKFQTIEVAPGQFMSLKSGETVEQAMARVERRGDTGVLRIGSPGAADRLFDRIRNRNTDAIALSESIPEWLKPGLARYASMFTEPFRFA